MSIYTVRAQMADERFARSEANGRTGFLKALFTALTFMAFTAVGGCSAAHSPNPFEGGRSATREIQIVVESSTFNDATVWVISQTRQARLGRVSGMASASFQIPWDNIEPLQLRVDLLAGQSYTTPSVTVSPGERVTLSLREPLSTSIISRGGR